MSAISSGECLDRQAFDAQMGYLTNEQAAMSIAKMCVELHKGGKAAEHIGNMARIASQALMAKIERSA